MKTLLALVSVGSLTSLAVAQPTGERVPSLMSTHGLAFPGYGLSGNLAAVWGDVNGNGRIDLVALRTDGTNVTVTLRVTTEDLEFEEIGEQTFQIEPPTHLADLNRDGLPDLVIPESNQFLPSLGTSFGPPETYAVLNVVNASFFESDYDDDGTPDLFVERGDFIYAVTGTIGDTFLVGPPAPWTFGAVVDDFDGNGTPDVLLEINEDSDNNGFIRMVYDIDTSPNEVDYPLSGRLFSRQIPLGDINGDGITEFAQGLYESTSGEPGSVVIVFEDGVPVPFMFVPLGIDGAGEFNGNDEVDLLIRDGNDTVRIHYDFFASAGPAVSKPLWEARVLPDYNGDGINELEGPSAIVNPALFLGDTPLPASVDLRTGNNSYEEPYTGTDFNDDGALDLVINTGRFLNDGSGRFTALASSEDLASCPISTSVRVAHPADLDGNGLVDIVSSCGLSWFAQDLTTFVPGPTFPDGEHLGVTDLDGDGRDDVVVLDRESTIVSLCYSREGVIEVVDYPSAGAFAEILSVADYNSDGLPDIATIGPIRVSLLLQQADGTFESLTHDGIQSLLGGVSPVDIDGDGVTELALVTAGDSEFHTRLQVFEIEPGTGLIPVRDESFVSQRPTDARFADVNGDGRPDLLTATRFSLNLYLDATASPLAQPFVFGTGGGEGNVLLVEDVNGDGLPDFSTDFGSRSDPIFTSHTSPLDACPADINADGFLDLADIRAFVNAFLAADPAADLNADGILDTGDLRAFVDTFIAGC